MTLIDVREALRDAIKAQLPTWSAYARPQAVTSVPCVVIAPSTDVEIPSAEYAVSFGKAVKWYLDIMILVPSGEMTSSQNMLDLAVSADTRESIPWCVNMKNSPLLAERFSYIKVLKMGNYGGSNYGVAGIEHMGAVIKLEAEEICRPIA